MHSSPIGCPLLVYQEPYQSARSQQRVDTVCSWRGKWLLCIAAGLGGGGGGAMGRLPLCSRKECFTDPKIYPRPVVLEGRVRMLLEWELYFEVKRKCHAGNSEKSNLSCLTVRTGVKSPALVCLSSFLFFSQSHRPSSFSFSSRQRRESCCAG